MARKWVKWKNIPVWRLQPVTLLARVTG